MEKEFYFWDAEGKRYLDFSSQLMNLNIGHQHPKVIQAIQEQAAKLCYAHPSFATEARGRLGEKIAQVAPKGLRKHSSVWVGLKRMRMRLRSLACTLDDIRSWPVTARTTARLTGAIALTGDYRRLPVEPAMPGVVHFLDPHCYHCPFGWTRETCHRECIKHVEEVIKYEGPEYIAAIIMEGVTGSNGLIVPPDDYWPRVREICDKYGILLISDEVMSGWGRTGKWFAVDHWEVVPDIITTAKGLTSGYVPLGAVIVSEKIAQHFENNMLWCGLTYSAHPLACAAGLATIAVYEQEGLIENAVKVGKHLGEGLENLKARHLSVGDARFIGLFSALELVKDRETKEPNPAMADIGKFLRANGLFTFIFGPVLFVVPPLVINVDQIDEGLAIIERALRIADAACG